MHIDELERLAVLAIGKPRREWYLFINYPPIVQIKLKSKLPDSFPIANEYVGFRNETYFYNLDAISIIRYVQRYKAEFVVD